MTAPKWTEAEDDVLREGVTAGRGYAAMAARLPGRSAAGCRDRAQRLRLVKPRKRVVPLYTAKQAAIALIAAARRFDLVPEDIACAPAGQGMDHRVARARKVVALSLAAENGQSPAAIAFALGWHATRGAASVCYAPSVLKHEAFERAIRDIRSALRWSCADDRPVAVSGKELCRPSPPPKPPTSVSCPGGWAGERAGAGSPKKPPPPPPPPPPPVIEAKPVPVSGKARSRTDSPEEAGPALYNLPEEAAPALSPSQATHQHTMSGWLGGGEGRCRSAGDSPPEKTEGRCRSAGESPPGKTVGRNRPAGECPSAKRPVSKPTADYSKMSAAQIAEHEMCEALLRDADRSEGQRAYAGALARQSLRGVV